MAIVQAALRYGQDLYKPANHRMEETILLGWDAELAIMPIRDDVSIPTEAFDLVGRSLQFANDAVSRLKIEVRSSLGRTLRYRRLES